MPNTSKAILVASSDTVFKEKMTAFDTDFDPVSEERHDAVARDKQAWRIEV
jgi:hypothetical protein